MIRFRTAALAAGVALWPGMALASEGLDGSQFGVAWAIPFIGILLSIAIFPLAAPHVWEKHQGKIAALWGAAVIVPMGLVLGTDVTVETLAHTLLLEYIPFILLLFALFTTAGGILLAGNLHGSPVVNTLLLAVGTCIASVIGTTGASMVLIRPILRANDNRRYNAHIVVFFIFLVSNIGGSLTPLGDPPLFLGFLKGVGFFWTAQHLYPQLLFASAIVLTVFFVLDTIMYKREGVQKPLRDPTPDSRLRLRGKTNMALIGVIIAAILMSAYWQPGIGFEVLGVHLELPDVLRDLIFIVVAVVSMKFSNPHYRQANGFSWGPIIEVAKLFGGIFTAMIPVLAMLKAGSSGAFAPLVSLTTGADGAANNVAYFWLTGALSSFLDNAPTYLVFFQLAGGDPAVLMTAGAATLAAISCGAVFMGANSYIGNAPNFMVYAIARERGVKMPSFFGYMGWSVAILIPTFILVTLIFFL